VTRICSGSSKVTYFGSMDRPSCIAGPDRKKVNDNPAKMEFIRQHKDEFKIYFVDEFYNWRDMHRKYPRSKYYSPPALAMGNFLKKMFGYSEQTSAYNVLNHFKKLFIKLYPEYEFQTVKR
jgi:hypothetical protein